MFGTVLIAIVAAIVPLQSPAAVSQLHMRDTKGKLCLSRTEDSGAMNGQPSWVDVFNLKGREQHVYRIKLSGGQSACVSLAPGRYTVVITSNVFDGPPSGNPKLPDSKACKSAPRIANLRAHERVTLDIWPALTKSNGGGYSSCGWDVLPLGTPQPGNCMVWSNLPSCQSGFMPASQGLTTWSTGRSPAARARAGYLGR